MPATGGRPGTPLVAIAHGVDFHADGHIWCKANQCKYALCTARKLPALQILAATCMCRLPALALNGQQVPQMGDTLARRAATPDIRGRFGQTDAAISIVAGKRVSPPTGWSAVPSTLQAFRWMAALPLHAPSVVLFGPRPHYATQ
jgi:hypothetical protein